VLSKTAVKTRQGKMKVATAVRVSDLSGKGFVPWIAAHHFLRPVPSIRTRKGSANDEAENRTQEASGLSVLGNWPRTGLASVHD
jgi:hypothetical protein